MFISRRLRIALLISLFWHFFWLSFVSIIFLPSGLKPKQYSAVYFLGSIVKGPIHFAQASLDRKSYLRRQLPDSNVDKKYFSERPYASLPIEREPLNPDSVVDVDLCLRPSYSGVSTEAKASVDTSAQQREIIYQPPLPQYPEWIDNQEFKGSPVIFKIYICGDGLVQEIINLQASGSTEVDVALARYIKRWRFAPNFGLPGHWQTIKINLDADGSTPLTIGPEQSRATE